MKASHTAETAVVYSSKLMDTIATESHGTTGWHKIDNTLEEVVYFQKEKLQPGIWMPIVEYRDMRCKQTRQNREYYELHPYLLGEKIQIQENEKEARKFSMNGNNSIIRGLPWDMD